MTDPIEILSSVLSYAVDVISTPPIVTVTLEIAYVLSAVTVPLMDDP